jgi:hypothetical protein
MFTNPYAYGRSGIGFVPTRQAATAPAAATRKAPAAQTRDPEGRSSSMGPKTGASQATIADVSSPIGRNMGLAASMLGQATMTPGLGLVGSALQTANEIGAYSRAMPGLDINAGSAFLNNASPFGVFGASAYDQARGFAREAGFTGTQAGSRNAFGGVNVGRDTAQARAQGRGGAAPDTSVRGAMMDPGMNPDGSAAGGDDGGCFITTATVGQFGWADDCRVLQMLRKFRDEHVPEDDIAKYYRIAPAIASRMGAEDAKTAWRYIKRAVKAIAAGNNVRAYRIYKNMICTLDERAEMK